MLTVSTFITSLHPGNTSYGKEYAAASRRFNPVALVPMNNKTCANACLRERKRNNVTALNTRKLSM